MNKFHTKLVVIFIIFAFTGINCIQAKPFSSIEKNNIIFNSEDVDFFDLNIKFQMMKARMPSLSICIIKDENIVFYKGYGHSNKATRQKPTKDTVYPVYSITKTITGTAIMQLWEKGYFDLEDDVNDYLDFDVRHPDYPDIPITFRMLLAHQASMMKFTDISAVWQLQLFLRNKEIYPYPFIKEILNPNGIFYKETVWEDYAPGLNANYSNINIMLLEYLVEVISGQSYPDYCQKNIFEPLNMNNSSFYFNDFENDQLARLYHNLGPFYLSLPFSDIHYGAAGLKSSIQDLSHYVIAYINNGVYEGKRILKTSTIEKIFTIQYPQANICNGNQRYGLTWVCYQKEPFPVGHGGHGPGGTSFMIILPEKDIGIIFFTNKWMNFHRGFYKSSWNEIISSFIEKSSQY